jgi:hypothetical protein
VYAHRCTHGGGPRPHLIVQCSVKVVSDVILCFVDQIITTFSVLWDRNGMHSLLHNL